MRIKMLEEFDRPGIAEANINGCHVVDGAIPAHIAERVESIWFLNIAFKELPKVNLKECPL